MPRAVVSVYRSHRTEALAAALGNVVAEPVGGPFEREWIVVQSRGMATWLSMELSRLHGVWANSEFLFPRRLVDRALRLVPAGGYGDAAFSPGRLLWGVLAALPDLLPRQAFTRLRRYLGDDPGRVRRFQLARRIAQVFDRYLVYRPEMVLAWQRGEDHGAGEDHRWQPILWRALVERLGGDHIAAAASDLAGASAAAVPDGMPRRVAVFGVATLPPLFVRVLAGLARSVDVHVFLPTPCRSGDRGGEHALLAGLGALGADFEVVLDDALRDMDATQRLADVPAPRRQRRDTALARLQAAILGGGGGAPAQQMLPFADGAAAGTDAAGDAQRSPSDGAGAADGSIAVHSCHGPMREVEVLRDQLLDLLAQPGGVDPRDVVVMMPDVDAYAPLVEATFPRDVDDPLFVPYRIADRTVRSESPLLDAFLRILSLAGGRGPASEVLDLLRLEPVQRRFGIAAADVEQLTDWVVQSGVRWGVDEEHRARRGQPALRDNTWRFGLDRMLLGYAMPGEGRGTFAGVLPYDEIEGREGRLLGRLAEFCARLFAALDALETPRDLVGWRDVLTGVLDALLAGDARDAWERERIRVALEAILTEAGDVAFDDDVDLRALRPLLEAKVDDAHPERGFLGGGVTFCAFVPMRSIPFKVVAMLGMSDGAFPRADTAQDFDLVARGARRAGDRSRRSDDRHLFLEAVLSARERIIVTYTGQSIRDNAPLPPSVVVSELLDAATADQDQRERLVVRHPLQPFSRRYFEARDDRDPRLFSYARSYLSGAESQQGERRVAPALVEAPLPAEGEGDDAVSLGDLVRFFRNPAAYLLNRRLGIWLDDSDRSVPDREPLVLDALEHWQSGTRQLGLHLRGEDPARARALERGHGALPPGTPGDCVHAAMQATVAAIAERAGGEREGEALPAVSVHGTLPDGTLLTGVLGDVWPVGRVRHQFSKLKAKYLLQAWIEHLALCWTAPDEVRVPRTVLVGRAVDGSGAAVCRWRPVADAGAELARLVALFRAGQRAPLRMGPEASMEFARQSGDDSGFWPLVLATKAWNERDVKYDAHMRRVFGASVPPFTDVVTEGPPFEELSLALWGPLLADAEEEA